MSRREEQFRRRIEELLRQAREMPEETVQRVLAMLEEARSNVIGRIASAREGSYTRFQLEGLLEEIKRVMREFEGRAAGVLRADQSKAHDFGAKIVDEPFQSVDIHAPIIGLSRVNLVIAQGYSADLISDVSRDTLRQINRALQRSLLGGVPMQETIDRIGRALTGEAEAPSFFSKAGERAATITRNEIHRMLDMGTQERLEQYAERARQRAGLLGKGPEEEMPAKEWRHTPQEHPRLGHLLLDKQTVPAEGLFTNPSTGIELGFPHDPNAPASEVINCKCFIVPAFLPKAA